MNPVATSDAAFRGGACPTPEYTIAYTGNYTTSADANPHHPGKDQSRYGNTRNWRSMVGNIGTMGMQYHIVHHLHPYIPLTRTPAAYREMLPILKARGCSLEMV
ncbi:Oxidoreductase [Sphingopyxis macrogoltabida]|uniref:Oxidoreductase n=2 Tax=Sphingopyxis macrogoltabida TaxID=33050 RepID=A0AAC8Z1S5_SPHMC|nr:fatty acid desaturase [Sphingopyxis macrogoltabida]AMU90207.1 Oxidoreductase [Sphingopyxis macrogoltabida]